MARPRGAFVELLKIVGGGAVGIALSACLLRYGFGIDVLGDSPPTESRTLSRPSPGNSLPVALASVTSDDAPNDAPTAHHQRQGPRAEQGGNETLLADDLGAPQLDDPPNSPLPRTNPDDPNANAPEPTAPTPPAAQTARPAARVSLPPADLQTTASARVRELFRKELGAAKSRAEHAQLARTLSEHSTSIKESTDKYALLRVAYDEAVLSADYELARSILDSIAKQFDVDALNARRHLISELANTTRPGPERAQLATEAVVLANQLGQRKEYEEALQVIDLAMTMATGSEAASLRRTVLETRTRLASEHKFWQRVAQAVETLRNDPNSKDACLTYGLYLCLNQNDWANGLPQLAKGSQEQLKAAADKDISFRASGDELTLGDIWYDIGAGEDADLRPFWKRAAYWYERVSPAVNGLERIKINKRLREIADWQRTTKDWQPGPALHYRRTLTGSGGEIWTTAFAPDGQHVAAGASNGMIQIWEVETGAPVATLKKHTSGVRCVAFSPDGQTLASAGWDSTIRLWNTHNWRERLVLAGHSGKVHSVEFAPDSETLWSAGADGTIRAWSARTGREVKKLEAHTAFVNYVAISPDGKALASTGGDRKLIYWDAQSPQPRSTLSDLGYEIRALHFAPKGNLLASANLDNTARLWDPATGTCVGTMHGHAARVESVAFSPDGKLLISTGDDQSIRLWDIASASEVFRVTAHEKRIFSLAVAPATSMLASASQDGTVKLWSLPR